LARTGSMLTNRRVERLMKNNGANEEIKKLKARIQDLSSLIEVSIIINSTLDLEKLIGLVMEKAQSVMRAEASSVMLINEKTGKLECEVALGEYGEKVRKTISLDKGQGVAGWVWEHDEPLIVQDVEKDERFFADIDRQSGFRTRTILAVPLKVKDRIIGVAEVINRTDGKQFTRDDLELFSTFGRQVAMAIDNARMHKIALEQERMRQQLESAKIIQQSFMPQVLPSTPRHKFGLAAENIPAISVSGDFYDALLLDDDTLGLVIGDVAGKGIPAALYMARLMSDCRFYAQQQSEPDGLLSLLNDTLVTRSRSGMFVTFQFTVIDLASGSVAFANGGHLPIIHVSSQDHQARLIDTEEGIPLGIARDVPFTKKVFQLQHGDILFYYTDGFIETRNRKEEQFSLDRLLSLASRKWDSAQTMLQKLLDEVKRFSQGMPQHDDLTAVAFQWNG